MKWVIFLSSLLLVGGILADDLDSDEIPDDILDDSEENDEILRGIERKGYEEDLRHENMHAAEIAARMHAGPEGNPEFIVPVDPCSKIHCGAGRICEAKGENARCICIPECPEESDPRRKVCTNRNETWDSDCEVHRHRCLCDTNEPACRDPEHSHIHIDYYGECKELSICSVEEMLDFPRRMREWLFNVMRDLADRRELPKFYIDMSHEAETNLSRRWVNAAIWKWCDLDRTHDRSISRHELFPIRAPLMALEHCIAPFLEGCDKDDDHRITLQEWGKCLELEDGELTERCDEINANSDEVKANEI